MAVVIGLTSASQSATGKNIGCDEESSKHAAKRNKVVKEAHSTSGNEPVGDDMRDWKIYVFACMKKPQFENWIRRKNFAAKLAGKCSVVLTPEQVRRSSERWYRRVKKQLRRTSHSSKPQTEDLETSDCLEFDFDDMDVESNCVKVPSGNKEQSCSSVSKELQQCESVNNDNIERCTVHSTRMEHHASPGTERSEVVHRLVNFNSVDDCNYGTIDIDKKDDLMCDKEVSIILKQDDMDDVSTSNVVNDDANSSVLGSVTSKSAGKNIPVKAEQPCDDLEEDQVTLCEGDDVRTSPTSEAKVGCNKQQDDAKEIPVAEVLEESTGLHSDGEGNGGKVIDGENEGVLGPGFGEVIDGQGGSSQEQGVAADFKSVRKAEVIQVTQHDQGMEGTSKEVTDASLLHTKDTVAEDAKMDVTGSSQAGVLKETAEVNDDQESCQDPASVARQGIQDVENALVHTDSRDAKDTKYSLEDDSVGEGNKVESQMGTDDTEDKPPFTATAEPQTNIDGNFDKATVVLEQDKTDSVDSGETNTTMTNRSLMMSSAVRSFAELSEPQSGSLTTIVSTPNQPKVVNLPALQRPSLNAVTTPIVPVTSCFSPFQPFQQNLVWPVVRHTSPFTTAGIVPVPAPVPVYAPTHPPGNYGFDPSWVDHPLHAPIPVGCVRSHSTYEDICPPGTEKISLEPSSDSADLVPGPETQEEETSNTMDDKQLPGSVMDNSVVTALMQFYSEIEEVEDSERNGVKGADDTIETNFVRSLPKPVEESTQTKSSKSHETTSDMEVESDREDGDKDVSEDVETSGTGGVANPGRTRAESLNRAGKFEGKNGEAEFTETSTKQSQSAGGMVCSKVNITLVENRVNRTEVENPMMMNLETTNDETQAKNPKVETERAQVINTGFTGDRTRMEYPNVTMNESLVDNPDNSMDITLSAKLDTDETVAENGTLVENANAAIDKTKAEKANDPIETILAKEPDDATNETPVDSQDIAVDGTQMEDPYIAAGGTHAEEPPSKSILAEEPDVVMNETLVDSLDIAVDGTQIEEPCIVSDGTHAEDPDDAIIGGLKEEHRETHAEEPADAIMEGLEEAHRGTHAEGPDEAIMGGLEEEHRGTLAEEPADAIMEGVEEAHRGTHAEGPDEAIMEDLEEEHSLSPIDPLFMANAEQTIFSSIGDLTNLLGQSSTFDRIAEEAIASTVSSLEDVLRQAHSSYLYHESSSCPSDSGVSVGEEVSVPSRSFSNIPMSTISPQDGDASKIGSVPGWSVSSCLSAGMQPRVVTATDARANDKNGTTSYINTGLSIT